MKDLAYIIRKLADLEARLHEGMIPTTDENGAGIWIEDREAISLVRELLHAAHVKGDDMLSLSDLPEDLRSRVNLWANAQPKPNGGEISRFAKEQCAEIVRRL